jgi:hypothetical protein
MKTPAYHRLGATIAKARLDMARGMIALMPPNHLRILQHLIAKRLTAAPPVVARKRTTTPS